MPFGLQVCSLDSGPFLTSWPYPLPSYLLFLPLWHSRCHYQGAPSQQCHLGEFSSQKQTHAHDGIWFFTNSIRQDRLGFAVITNNSQISNVTWLSSVCLFNHMMVPRWPSMKLHFNRRHQAFFKCEKRGHGELWFVRLPSRSELDWTCKLTSPVLLSRAGKYNPPLCPEGKGDGKCWWVAAMLTTQWVFKASVYPRRCSRSPSGVRRHSGISSYVYSLSSPFKISIFLSVSTISIIMTISIYMVHNAYVVVHGYNL